MSPSANMVAPQPSQRSTEGEAEPVLSVEDLVIDFATERGTIRAVDGVSFALRPGETLGIVGESGCGKSVTAQAILGLIPSPPGRIHQGRIRFHGQDLVGLSERRLRQVRGGEIAMIFQEPMTALNPVYTVGRQLIDVIHRHRGLGERAARELAAHMLDKVGIPKPITRLAEHPHRLSGGMRQRVMIAMALACDPKILIADEPTTALDVTTQAQVLEQIVALQQELGMAVILITHDLGVVAETCDRALVMYCGEVIEQAPVEPLFDRPRHPYTAGLLRSIPRISTQRRDRLEAIPGMVPDLHHLPPGCRFADRCERAQPRCWAERPVLSTSDLPGTPPVGPMHAVAGDTHAQACFYPVGAAPEPAST